MRRAAAPGPEEELEKDEGATARVIATEADACIATDLACKDAIGSDLRQRAENLARRFMRDLRRTAFVDVRV